MKISIIGTGNVAQALAKGLAKNKHEVTFGSRELTKNSPITEQTSNLNAMQSVRAR